MTTEELQNLEKIAYGKGWEASKLLKEYLKTVKAENHALESPKLPQNRTGAQHRALFLWYGQIEQICANEGITWDRLVKHTHQLRVTKENLHEAGKQLQKALWGKASTKELEKKQINTLIDHFIEWFAKEGVELPPFPHEEKNVKLKAMDNAQREDYPEYIGPPTI